MLDSRGEYIYYMSQIHKTSLDTRSGIVPLLKYYKNGKIDLEFPENEAVTLFSSIVPALEKCCMVKVERKLEEKFFREELITKTNEINGRLLIRAEKEEGTIIG